MEAPQCLICLEEIHPPQSIWIEPLCGLVSHDNCMRHWFRNQCIKRTNEREEVSRNFPPKCPHCRAVIPVIQTYANSPALDAAGGYDARWIFKRILDNGLMGLEMWRPLTMELIDDELDIGSQAGICLVHKVVHGPVGQAAWLVHHQVPEDDFLSYNVFFFEADWTPQALEDSQGMFATEAWPSPEEGSGPNEPDWRPFLIAPYSVSHQEFYLESTGTIIGRVYLYMITPELLLSAEAEGHPCFEQMRVHADTVPAGRVPWICIVHVPEHKLIVDHYLSTNPDEVPPWTEDNIV